MELGNYAGKTIYGTATGIKVGSKGKVNKEPVAVLNTLPKGFRRQIRKAAHGMGLMHIAAAR